MKTMKIVLLAVTFYFSSPQLSVSRQIDNIKNSPTSEIAVQTENWTWQKTGTALGLDNIDNVIIDPQDSNLWYVISVENGLYITRDGGAHWTHAINKRGLDAEGLQIDPTNPNIVYAGVWDKVYKSEDRGKTWSIVYTCPEYIRSVLVSKIDGSIYLGPQTDNNSNPAIYKSTDGGHHFTAFPFGVNTHYILCWDIVEDSANNVLYVSVELADHPQPYSPPLFRSFDGGHTWQNIAFVAWHAQKMGVNRFNGSVYFLTEGGTLYRSRDFGSTWTTLSGQAMFFFLLDPDHSERIFGSSSYEAGVKGAWMSENGGKAFAALGLDEIRVTAITMNSDHSKLYSSTWGDGLWVADVPEYVPFSGIRVANTKDTGLWSLREAIKLANVGSGADTIRFNIPQDDPGYDPSSGAWTIAIEEELPMIMDDSLYLNGYSQRELLGEDTNSDGPEIVLTTNSGDIYNGLLITSSYNRISHIVVNGIVGSGIGISGQSAHHNVIEACYLGTGPAGKTAHPNQTGIYIYDGGDNRIGSVNAAEGNIISGNSIQGLVLSSSGCINNLIVGNKIGLTPGKQNLGNQGSGVFVGGNASKNKITENEIAFNSSSGIAVFDAGTEQNTFSQNSIYDNVNSGIFMFIGANGDIQPPVLTIEAGEISGETVANATIEIFSDQNDQGKFFQGSVTADANGHFAWTEKVQGPYVTATATDVAGNTSAFSNAVIPPNDGEIQTFIVTSTNETGAGSITEAISAAQNVSGSKRILFQIPKLDPGFDSQTGVWTIKTTTGINIHTDSLTIDGSSQSDFIGEDCNPDGPEIMFSGQLMGAPKYDCFVAQELTEFNVYDVVLSQYSAGISFINANGGCISGCYIGSDPSGTDSLGNDSYGIYLMNSSQIIIGGTESTAGNLLLGGFYSEIYLEQCSDISITGNIMGIDRLHEHSLSNPVYGPIVVRSSNNIEVSLNIVGGGSVGLTSWQSERLLVRENYFNISQSWEKIGSLSVGVWLSDSSHDNIVQDNKIGFCQLYAIGIQEGAVRNRLSRNLLSGNEFTGIYLSYGTNNNIASPTLLTASPQNVEGEAGAGNIIEVFNDEDGQAREYLGTTTADGSGHFSLILETTPNFANVTATATDADSNTSALSAPLAISQTNVQSIVANSALKYSLAQNYPNPFNPSTVIQFSVPELSRVSVKVYNMLGQEIATLIDKICRPGIHKISWDGKNNAGAKVGDGIYLYQIKAGNFHRTMKMLLLQ